MGIATHLGPWLLGTVRSTTGTTAGTVRNLGATTVGQPFTVTVTAGNLTGSLGFLPAGSVVTAAYLYVSTAFNGTPSISFAVAGTTVTATPTFTAGVFNGTLALTQTAGAAAVLANVGATDAAVTYSVSGAGTNSGVFTFVIEYLVRNSDGTIYPTSYTGP
jgi:hypothetical protein